MVEKAKHIYRQQYLITGYENGEKMEIHSYKKYYEGAYDVSE